jgi:pimeloyl-ACP methyl ester carboxylesterase
MHPRARFITPDWRGCGRSDHPAYGNTIGGVAADVLELLDRLDIRDGVLVGSSLGGNIALEAALADRSRLAGLVLVDAPQHFFADGIDRAAFWAWHASLRRSRADVVHRMTPDWFGPGVGPATHRFTAELLLRSGWFIDDLLADASSHDRRADLPSLDLPVALLHGALDSEVPQEVPRAGAALLPNATLQIFQGAGHMPHIEVPEAFNASLAGFLNSLDEAATVHKDPCYHMGPYHSQGRSSR